jgi:membrane dipeptidase
MPANHDLEALKIHQRAYVWDAHCDSLQRVVVDGIDLGAPGTAQADLDAWQEGGVKVQVFAAWVDVIYGPNQGARRALEQIAAFHQFLARHPARVGLATTAAEIRALAGEGRLAAVLAVEGGLAIQGDIGLLERFAHLGVTSMTLTHATSLDWIDSSTDAPRAGPGGLSDFGRDVVAEMNRLKMVVDVSHVSDDAIRQVARASVAPIIASHSSSRAICDHPRNLTDDLARVIADTGGVIGINFVNEILDQATCDRVNPDPGAALASLRHDGPPIALQDLDRVAGERLRRVFSVPHPRPPFERILEHILHFVKLLGADHVGLGADLDGGPVPVPEGFETVRDYPRITEALWRGGMADRDIEKVMGNSFLRVFEAVRGA